MSPRTAFNGIEAYTAQRTEYRLLPFQFMRLEGRVLVVNEVGEHDLLTSAEFEALVQHTLPAGAEPYLRLKSGHFLVDGDTTTPARLLVTKLRTRKGFLKHFTKLHIFVVTLRCDHSCHYCQVSRVSVNRSKYDMTTEHADRALDLVFRSPAQALKIEFQGGEPLLNFSLIEHIVQQAERRNATEKRKLSFVVTTNLSTISAEMLVFLKTHRVAVSTSLDGPAFLHNANRPRPGNDAHELVVAGIRRVREALGYDAVSALMTTTRNSLAYPAEIVDEYVANGFDRIFLRPLSPYGFARRSEHKTGYRVREFVDFYKRALDRIIDVNRQGTYVVELYAQIVLTKILTPFATGYVDLRSPTGAGIGVAVYNYDGDVYATDESRMLAQMGDTRFRLGNLDRDSYESIFGGARVRELVEASCVESLPGCADCALNAYCGADPIENYATQGDIAGYRPTSHFCERNMEIMKHLLRLYYSGDEFLRDLFWSWVQNAPCDELLPVVPA